MEILLEKKDFFMFLKFQMKRVANVEDVLKVGDKFDKKLFLLKMEKLV